MSGTRKLVKPCDLKLDPVQVAYTHDPVITVTEIEAARIAEQEERDFVAVLKAYASSGFDKFGLMLALLSTAAFVVIAGMMLARL